MAPLGRCRRADGCGEEQADLQDGLAACLREAATLVPGTGRWPGLDAWYKPLGSAGQMQGAACIQNVDARTHPGWNMRRHCARWWARH